MLPSLEGQARQASQTSRVKTHIAGRWLLARLCSRVNDQHVVSTSSTTTHASPAAVATTGVSIDESCFDRHWTWGTIWHRWPKISIPSIRPVDPDRQSSSIAVILLNAQVGICPNSVLGACIVQYLLHRILLLSWNPVQQRICQDGLQDLCQRGAGGPGPFQGLLTGPSEDALHARHSQRSLWQPQSSSCDCSNFTIQAEESPRLP